MTTTTTLRPAYTHAVPVGMSDWRLFNITECDACGRTCQAPNTHTIRGYNGRRANLMAGLTITGQDYPEVWACDALGGIAVCEDCYVDETPEPEPTASAADIVDAHLAAGGNRATLKAAARALDLAPLTEIRRMKRPALVTLLGRQNPETLAPALAAAM